MAEEERQDFYLYVDEFQNFATSSFVKILSEARKYRLNLTVANQYIGQLTEEVMKAIFGNVGSLLSFIVGASDARFLAAEFGETFEPKDLVSLGKYQLAL
jgi:type IV secretory pathway TraG/TraD family ATPase VirD4